MSDAVETEVRATQSGMPEGWREVALGEVSEIKTGKTPSRGNPEFWGDNSSIQFITPSDISGSLRFIGETARTISSSGGYKFINIMTPKNTIAVTCIGSDMGKVVITKSSAITNQQINSLIINRDNDYKYFYYLLRNSYKILRQNAEGGGSTMPIINKTDFGNLLFTIPQLGEQKAIAGVLSAFDDKIELLREQNQTLEQTAQAIFKEWFGKYSPDEPQNLPNDWRVGEISDFGNVVCGKTPSKAKSEYFDGGIQFVKIPDMHGQIFINKTEDSLSLSGSNSQANKLIPANSICVSCIATVGLVSITAEPCHTNQQINSIVVHKIYYLEYIYLRLKSMKKVLENIGSGGSATLNINTGVFSKIEIVKPADGRIEKFSQAVGPMFEKIKDNSQQIQTLTKTRDTLLPKLMTGEVRVGDEGEYL